MKRQAPNCVGNRQARLRFAILALGMSLLFIGGCQQAAETSPRANRITLSPTWDGHYHGSAEIGDTVAEVDALLTPDGRVRIRIGAPSDDFALVRPSMQFIGSYESREAGAFGTGVLTGQGCGGAEPGIFCSEAVQAELELFPGGDFSASPGRQNLVGTLQVLAAAGTESWSITTIWFDQSYLAGSLWVHAGQYLVEPWTEITSTGTLLNVDANRDIFLQSPVSGCVASATIAVGTSVAMQIDNCVGEYAYLNGSYTGLASQSCWDPWEYACYGLTLWLSSPVSALPPAAVTITATWIGTLP